MAAQWERIALVLLRLGGASTGNQTQMFCDGDGMFEAMWAMIAASRRRVLLEMYILEPDRVGLRTLELLADAAKRGCEVRVLLDAVGSSRITDAHVQPLRDRGGIVEFFNPLRPLARRRSLLQRDHRKIIVVDDEVGSCGGMNVSEDYAGTKHGNGRFRDCQIMVRGPAVRDLTQVFASSWRRQTGATIRVPPAEQEGEGKSQQGEGKFVQVLASSGGTGRRSIQKAMRLTIGRAARHCRITNPYFVPPPRLMRAMAAAAKRGVDVQVMTAGLNDVPLVRCAARHIYGWFLRRRVRIFEMFERTLHSKTVEVDGVYGTVGTFNFDRWSYARNLEVNVAALDGDVATELQRQWEADMQYATEVTLCDWERRSWWRRLVDWAAYQLLKL